MKQVMIFLGGMAAVAAIGIFIYKQMNIDTTKLPPTTGGTTKKEVGKRSDSE